MFLTNGEQLIRWVSSVGQLVQNQWYGLLGKNQIRLVKAVHQQTKNIYIKSDGVQICDKLTMEEIIQLPYLIKTACKEFNRTKDEYACSNSSEVERG